MIEAKKVCIGSALLLVASFAFAQTGTVRGTVLEADTGMPVPFANIIIAGTSQGFTTDMEGAFSHDLTEGIYTFEISYVGYSKYRLEDVAIKRGQVTLLDIEIQQDEKVLDEVVVKAEQFRNTQGAMLGIQRKSLSVVNGISSQSFRKLGDNNAGSAVRRVTGVSVDEGKYVFVRGLGDRYSKTMLNGMDIPGLDPDRNSLQMDIFPTHVLDNIIVSKTSMADMPGDFTGGIIDITTKDFPEEKKLYISVGTSYNPNMHFNSNFLSSEKSSTDWLGFDKGLRDLPVDKNQRMPPPIDDPTLTVLTARFKNNMAARRTTSALNYNVAVSLGNQINRGGITFGYMAALGYRASQRLYDDMDFNSYIKDVDSTKLKLRQNRISRGTLGIDNRLLSGIIGGALKINRKHKISLTLLQLQNGKSTAGVFRQETFITASNTILRDNAEYTQSSLTNVLLKGDHYLSPTWTLKWKITPTYSTIRDKDVRITSFRLGDDGSLTIEPSEGAEPRRLWRNLNEESYAARVDAIKSFTFRDKDVNLQFGISNTYKKRNYEILSYLVRVKNQFALNLSGDPNKLFSTENIWTPKKQAGTYIVGNFEPSNTYNAYQNTIGAYVMGNITLTNNLKANVGVRMEHFTQSYTGQNQSGSVIFNNETILDNINFLPSLNVVYRINKSMNVRFSYSRTLARPSFKEASIAQIYDVISDRTFIGNIDLKQTDINNFDVRWEMFRKEGQLISFSAFYKTFINPIEIVTYSASAPDNFQPRNVGDANLIGGEVEFRQNLAFILPALKTFNISANLTLVRSSLSLDRSKDGEYDSRNKTRKTGESVSDTRPMQGQAPFIINTYISYTNNGWEANVSYNVQGSTLSVVGIGLNPDVYTAPYHDMSCKISKQLGKEKRVRISLGITNILNSVKAKYYQAYGTADQAFGHYRPYRTFRLGLSWKPIGY